MMHVESNSSSNHIEDIYIREHNALPQRESLNNYDVIVEIDE